MKGALMQPNDHTKRAKVHLEQIDNQQCRSKRKRKEKRACIEMKRTLSPYEVAESPLHCKISRWKSWMVTDCRYGVIDISRVVKLPFSFIGLLHITKYVRRRNVIAVILAKISMYFPTRIFRGKKQLFKRTDSHL